MRRRQITELVSLEDRAIHHQTNPSHALRLRCFRLQYPHRQGPCNILHLPVDNVV